MTDPDPNERDDDPHDDGQDRDGQDSDGASGDAQSWGVELTTLSAVDELDAALRAELGVPADRPATGMDVREAPPPEPLKRTLETLEAVADEVVVLQRNDRVPVHLFGRLDDRGYRHATVERDGEAVTAVWRE